MKIWKKKYHSFSFLFDIVNYSVILIIKIGKIIRLRQGYAGIKEKEMVHLTQETFKEKVFNYEKNKDWKFEGDKPAIIDFYADWCGPCKMVAPVLEELAKEYEGKLDIFKVNTEDQQELAAAFGIRSIPSILFVPKDDQPQMSMGALPKESFVKAIEDVLKVK